MINFIRNQIARLAKKGSVDIKSANDSRGSFTAVSFAVDNAARTAMERRAANFKLFCGGPAPEELRRGLWHVAEPFARGELMAIDVKQTLYLTGKLWNCTDPVPLWLRMSMMIISRKTIPARYTYAMAARFLRSLLVKRCVPEIDRRKAAFGERFVFVPPLRIQQQEMMTCAV